MSYPDSAAVPDYISMLGLKDRAFIVLGAGDGIGRQCCHALAQAGARVLCVDRDVTLAADVARQVDGIPLTADITVRSEAEQAFQKAREQFGSALSGVVDIVGMAQLRELTAWDDDGWMWQFNVVLKHAFYALQLGVSSLPSRGGSIVCIGSISGLVSVPKQAAYGAAKAALHHMVRCAAHEFGRKNVRVNAVAPGFVRTPRLLKALGDGFWQRASALNPMGRVAIPADIAAAVLFLCSDLAAYVTGNVLTLDGGVNFVAALPDMG